jgi:hypothetical protein
LGTKPSGMRAKLQAFIPVSEQEKLACRSVDRSLVPPGVWWCDAVPNAGVPQWRMEENQLCNSLFSAQQGPSPGPNI